MSCYLIIHCIEYDLIVPTELNKLYNSSSSSSSFFKFVLPCPFFKLWLSLFLNIKNNENNYEGAEREKRKLGEISLVLLKEIIWKNFVFKKNKLYEERDKNW